MTKTNKQLIKELAEYFMKQPQEHTCKMLAAMMIDLNRIVNFRRLGKEELDGLKWRVQWNVDQLIQFIHNGPNGDFKLEKCNSDED